VRKELEEKKDPHANEVVLYDDKGVAKQQQPKREISN
jgi:hypothetical protein